MRAWGLFLCPPKKHPHPLDAKQPAGKGNTPGALTSSPLRNHGTHTHTPATTGHGTGQGTTGTQGHSTGHANHSSRQRNAKNIQH